MRFYPTIITLHIIFAGVWLSSAILEVIHRKKIINKSTDDCSREVLALYLKSGNILGIISSLGILISGILLVVSNPAFSFFDMSSNHWLAAKQIIMIILLVTTFVLLIPAAKKLRIYILGSTESSVDCHKMLGRVTKFNIIIIILVILNFLLAITHRYL